MTQTGQMIVWILKVIGALGYIVIILDARRIFSEAVKRPECARYWYQSFLLGPREIWVSVYQGKGKLSKLAVILGQLFWLPFLIINAGRWFLHGLSFGALGLYGLYKLFSNREDSA